MFSFEHLYRIDESTKISLDEIETFTEEKLFISINSHIRLEKAFLTRKLPKLPIIDIDEYVTRVGGGIYERRNLHTGMKIFNATIDKALEGDKSFISICPNIKLNETKKRLQKSKDNQFTNIIVFIENRQKCEETNQVNLHDNINTLKKDNSLVDFYSHHIIK